MAASSPDRKTHDIVLPQGGFRMGSDAHYPEEAPARWCDVAAFSMDAVAVTNAAFKEFVDATGYITTSEQSIDPAQHPNMPDAFYAPGSLVFQMTNSPVRLDQPNQWWAFVPGAQWRHPEGPGSTINGRDRHPVVHVSYQDASAYADWAGKALPTETQWEYAASFCNANDTEMNIWRGSFPYRNQRVNTAPFTVPADANTPSSNGLFNMLGNVWEWTNDTFSPHSNVKSPCCTKTDTAANTPKRVLKGGSYLCAESYCRRYRPAARMGLDATETTGHIGFRCVSNFANSGQGQT